MNNRTISVVMDKSFLQAVQPAEISKIIDAKHRILVTAELAYEIFSTDKKGVLKKCFEDLLSRKDYVDIIDHLGTLFKIEIEQRKPCTPLSLHFLSAAQLNPNFNYMFEDNQVDYLKEFERDIEASGAVDFDKIIKEEIMPKCPKLKPSDIKDPKKVRDIYRKLRVDDLPPAEMMDEQWAIFRKLQVDCLAATEYADSLREGHFNITEKRKKHNQIDFRICIFALLTKGLAAKDCLLRRYFKFFCPDGFLFPGEYELENR